MSRIRVAAAFAVVVGAVVLAAVMGTAKHGSAAPIVDRVKVSALTGASQTTVGPGLAENEADALTALDTFWLDRTTYPSGRFDPLWLRHAASQDARTPRGEPDGRPGSFSAKSAFRRSRSASKAALSGSAFTALGPKPERMTGCSGCFNYTTTSGRINSIVVDPTTTTPGSIVAYSASVGGGVWKTTNCCSASTSWTVMSDDPLISSTSIDALAVDPNNHDTIYAGTGDLNFGSFSMGSQGILKSTNGGATWTVLGGTIFGPAYTQPAGNFPQYDAVGKVAVDPNDSNKVVAGTKKGLFFSYDAGTNWTGPCLTNSFPTQRQDITGLELTKISPTVTRIIAAVGARGFNSPVQIDLGQNGANGIYSSTMQASGCPTFTSITSDANFTFGTGPVTGSATYQTNSPLHATSGTPYTTAPVGTTPGVGNQLGRIELGVAPSDPNTIYAQVQSIAPNSNTGGSASCGGASGCQLGVWATTNGGATWSFMAGSAGGALRGCTNLAGDYAQNWYDQGIAVDPTNPDRVFISTFDVWFATRTGTVFNDLTCGYSFSGSAGPVHTDQHALAFAPGAANRNILMIGNDGGANGTINADAASSTVDPTWFNMDTGYNTIEFYDGDIGPNFANAAAPTAAGGAQDNMDSFVTFSGNPTAVQWQGNIGGDGFQAAIDGKGGIFYATNNSGQLHRCTANCSNPSSGTPTPNASWSGDLRGATARGEQQSFVMPFDLFRGNPAGSGNAECAGTRCNHVMLGTIRVWETVNMDAATVTWTARCASTNLTKQTLGNRSYINQLHYAPGDQTLGTIATNDGNVWMMYGLGGAAGVGANCVNVTGGNAVLPNRPILDANVDPTSQNTAAKPFVGYAAVGGFSANTPATPGHVFRVVCDVNCANFTWQDKSGTLPDIPVDSIIANPNNPQQVFAGTDFGLYYTNDISAATPTWYRFKNGLPNAMVWSLSIDRGNTALSVWTRSRGAYAWPLPTAPIQIDQTISFAPLAGKTYGDDDFTVSATASSGLPVTFTSAGDCTVSGATVHITGAGSCDVTATSGNIDYKTVSVTQSFAIAKAAQSITFAQIADKTWGDLDFALTAFSSAGLDVSFSSTGDCTVTNGSVHITGAGTCTVTADQPGNANYNAAPSVARTFTINKAEQTIEFATVGDKTFGDADFEITATATSSLTVSLSIDSGHCTISSPTSPAQVHISGAGTCVITASQPGSSNYKPAPSETRTFAVNRAAQTIDFGPLGDKTWGDPDFDVSAAATSHLPVSFSTTGDCTATGNTIHITGAGQCTVTALQGGSDDYNPAPDVARTFTIHRADQSINFAPLADQTYLDADVPLVATSSANLAVAFDATGNCVLNGTSVSITGAGSCSVTASQPGNSNYNAAPSVTRTFSIAKADQAITFAPLADKTYGDPGFTVSGTSTSGLPVAFGVSGNCVLLSGKVEITGAGSCAVTASQSGDANYNAAPSVSRTFSIAKSDQTITLVPVGDATYGDNDFEIDGTASSGLSVSLAATGPCTLSSAISPASVHITGAGTCAITASQDGDDNYNAAPSVTRSFSINKANQTITFNPLADKTYLDADFPVSATARSGLPVAFATTGNCTNAGAIVHITGAGTCTVTASQAGNADWNSAPDVSQSFAIRKAGQTITFAPLADRPYGTPDFTVAGTSTSSLPLAFAAAGSCTVAGDTVHITDVSTCTITASQPGNVNYEPAPSVARTFNIAWTFTGFFAPVDNGVVNVANAGSAIPVKFALGQPSHGLAIFAAGYPASTKVSCTTGAAEDTIETTETAGSSSLTYDASSGRYHYVWKTEKSWGGTCRTLVIKLADNTFHTANFRFK